MEYSAISDIGNSRSVNEDFWGAKIVNTGKERIGIFAIADGMGGHKKGEVASKIAVESSMKMLRDGIGLHESCEDMNIVSIMLRSYEHSNEMIIDEVDRNEECKGMGTTLTMAIIANGKMYVGNVGDSRCYLLREGRLERITNDNSLVQELIFKGLITEEEAMRHPQKNIITRAVGLDKPLKVDIYEKDILGGDHVLLTTDGLTNVIGHDEIQEVILNFKNIDSSCEELINRAKSGGGKDNISLIHILI